MAEIKACIFDLDGVLVETSHYHYLAWSRLGKAIGVEVTSQVNEELKGLSRRDSLEILLSKSHRSYQESEKIVLENEKNKWYLEYLKNIGPEDSLPGVKDFILELKSKDYRLAVGSSSRNAIAILKRLDLMDTFDAIVDGNAVSQAKPNPEIFIKAADKLGVKPGECLVFEDAISGVKAAKNGDFMCIGVGSKETLFEADFVIPSFAGFNLDVMHLLYDTTKEQL